MSDEQEAKEQTAADRKHARRLQHAIGLLLTGHMARARALFVSLLGTTYAAEAQKYLARMPATRTPRSGPDAPSRSVPPSPASRPRVLRSVRGKTPGRRVAVRSTDERIVRRTPHLDVLPEPPLKPGASFSADVYADASAARRGEVTKEIEITFPPGVDSLQVRVDLSPTDHFELLGAPLQEITLKRDKPRSTTARYELRVQAADRLSSAPGVPALCAYFTCNGRACGTVRRELPITSFKPNAAKLRGQPTKPRKQQLASFATDVGTHEADLTVEVLDPHNDGQHLHCTVHSPHLAAFRGGKKGRWDLPRQSDVLVREYFGKFTSDNRSARQTLFTLVGAGLQLFDAAPEVFREVFWALIDQRKPLRTISVVSQEPNIPWELMIPNRPRPGGREEWEAPLGVKYSVGRWIKQEFLSAPQRLPLDGGNAITPRYRGRNALKHAQKELKHLSGLFKVNPITPATLDGIEEHLKSAEAMSFLHFACHGEAGSEGDAGMGIVLEQDEFLDDVTLRGMSALKKAFGKTSPFVFMNACEVGRQKPALTGVGGLAPTFLIVGAAAVLAPLWTVKDDIAFAVAKEFYTAAKAQPDKPFAEILRDIRARAYRSPYEDSWAAYVFYGDPLTAQT